MVDIHCHIIPGIDDGAKDMDMSIDMIKCAQDDGTSTMIATPHYCSGVFENQFSDICLKVDELNQEIQKNGLLVNVLPGQEVLLSKDTIELYKAGEINGLNKSRYMLIELPFDRMPNYTLEVIYELRILGIVPILAHPERYEFIIQDLTKINEFIEEGCLFQINSHSISGMFGKAVKKTADHLLANRVCHFIASDAHSNRNRRPEINRIIKEVLRNDVELIKTLADNETKLINNEEIEYNTAFLKEKKSIFQFLRK
jgi:protein-tyrosine phosphatase